MLDLDFTPPNFHEARCLRSAIRLRASLIATMLVIMVLWVVANRNEIATAQAMLCEVQQQREQVSIHESRKAQMQAEQARLRAREQLLHHLKMRAIPTVILTEVSRCMGERVVLTEVVFESPSVALYARPLVKTESANGAAAIPTAGSSSMHGAGAAASSSDAYPPLARAVFKGIATDTPEVIGFVKKLEESRLISQVQLEQQGSVVWAGRRGQAFVIICQFYDQRGDER